MSASNSSANIQGLTSTQSSFGPKETMDRVEAEIQTRGLTVFARIDHAAGAADAGLRLAPTELIIFGNARGGTPLMQSAQTAGIDLPLKILVWQDAANNTWLSYNEPRWVAERHNVTPGVPAVSKMTDLVSAIVNKASTPQWQVAQSQNSGSLA
jgi:uncharacterized protein (DUF302 family)